MGAFKHSRRSVPTAPIIIITLSNFHPAFQHSITVEEGNMGTSTDEQISADEAVLRMMVQTEPNAFKRDVLAAQYMFRHIIVKRTVIPEHSMHEFRHLQEIIDAPDGQRQRMFSEFFAQKPFALVLHRLNFTLTPIILHLLQRWCRQVLDADSQVAVAWRKAKGVGLVLTAPASCRKEQYFLPAVLDGIAVRPTNWERAGLDKCMSRMSIHGGGLPDSVLCGPLSLVNSKRKSVLGFSKPSSLVSLIDRGQSRSGEDDKLFPASAAGTWSRVLPDMACVWVKVVGRIATDGRMLGKQDLDAAAGDDIEVRYECRENVLVKKKAKRGIFKERKRKMYDADNRGTPDEDLGGSELPPSKYVRAPLRERAR